MPGQEETTVFISYSHTDSDFVDRLEADLKARGFGTFVDRSNLEPGVEWPDFIQRKVEECTAMVVVLTQAALDSQWVRKEYHYALELKHPIIPLELETVPTILALNTIQRADFKTDYQAGLRTVLVALSQIGRMTQQTAQSDAGASSGSSSGSQQPASEPQQLSVSDLYSIWADALANHDLDRADIIGEQIQALDPDELGPIVAEQMKPFESELRDIRLKRLRGEANRVRAAGEWGQEVGAWQALLALVPDDEQALARLPIALHNRQPQYTKLYDVIKGLYDAGNMQAVKQQLDVLWAKAPYYGDPAGIAKKVGKQVPPTLEEEQAAAIERIHREEIRRKQELFLQQEIEKKRKENEKKREDEAAAVQIAHETELKQRQLEEQHRKELEEEWATYNKRRATYRAKKLSTSGGAIWLYALAFITTLATILFALINANLSKEGWFGTLITQGVAADLYNRGILRYVTYAVVLLVIALITYGLGYFRGLNLGVVLISGLLGGLIAFGLTFIPTSLLSNRVRFYTFPFQGTLHVPSTDPGNFCLAMGASYVIVLFIPAIISVITGMVNDQRRPTQIGRRSYRRAVDKRRSTKTGWLIGVGGLIAGFALGFVLAIPEVSLGWGWGGLFTGGLVGIFLGLGASSEEGLEFSTFITGIGIGAVIVLGLLTWLVFAVILKLDSALLLPWLVGIIAGMVAGTASGATVTILFTRAHHPPKPKEKLPAVATKSN